MTNIKTTEDATHYCCLHSNGALTGRCEKQCKNCKNLTPEELLKLNFGI